MLAVPLASVGVSRGATGIDVVACDWATIADRKTAAQNSIGPSQTGAIY
jgi:hypothetical protein